MPASLPLYLAVCLTVLSCSIGHALCGPCSSSGDKTDGRQWVARCALELPPPPPLRQPLPASSACATSLFQPRHAIACVNGALRIPCNLLSLSPPLVYRICSYDALRVSGDSTCCLSVVSFSNTGWRTRRAGQGAARAKHCGDRLTWYRQLLRWTPSEKSTATWRLRGDSVQQDASLHYLFSLPARGARHFRRRSGFPSPFHC